MFFCCKLNGDGSVRDKLGLCFCKSREIATNSLGSWDMTFFPLVLGLFHGQQEISCFKTNIPLVRLQAICLDIWSLFDVLTIYFLSSLVPGFSLDFWETWGWIFLWASLLVTDNLTLIRKFQFICEQNLVVLMFLLWGLHPGLIPSWPLLLMPSCGKLFWTR